MALEGERGSRRVEASWKRLVVVGMLIAILGLVALWNAVDATIATAVLVGYALAVAGITHAIGGFAPDLGTSRRIVHVLVGIIWVLVGINMVFNPLSGVLAITLVVSAMLLVEGVTRVAVALMRRVDGSIWMLAVGVIDVLLGLWLWTGFPFTGVAIGLFVGFELVLAGLDIIAIGWAARTVTAQQPAASA